MNLLLNIQRKTELFASFVNELENAKADIENKYDDKYDEKIKEIIEDFFHLYKEMNKESIEKLQDKIRNEMILRCKHEFVEEFCEICGLKINV